MQVYAVLYTEDGHFMLARKLSKGYFFYDPAKSQGAIVPDGQSLNGGDNYALPGGKRNKGESITGGAAREFYEETGVKISNQSVSVLEHQFSLQFGAGYFLASNDQIKTIHTKIQKTNLVAATNASVDIEHGSISQYSQIHQRYPDAPADNELEAVYIWSVFDKANWEEIEKWRGSPTLGWYYDILLYLRDQVLSRAV
ncbi:NUDIX hydrolase [Microbulbifer halophilus]|uniref:NUDIX hydrolase n=1 Tax=Microbulbifer halophilus TaxID=453963 RepID=A0ABW5EAD0_9GAMM|nr:NUDIX domain-containing protein [Microbulbifer halophilus]MCW8127573.1 NUDIX domain-containing protein [Microbulbifer halophilus]